ncbi:hypothetical protein M0804_013241 [Polistes exclamans]|nr:hypothetical protein M0804_013241 [Polistes exclamans]
MDAVDIGKALLKNFDPDSMDFLKWLNHFEYVVDIVHIPNNEKVEFLLNLLEPPALLYIQEKLAPTNPRNLSYEELMYHLEHSFAHYLGEFAANYRFAFRDQYKYESIPEYVLALRKISSKASPFLKSNKNLMKRFIHGLEDKDIQNVLNSCLDLTFGRAVVMAQQMKLHKIMTEMI